jgi:hypothetical protein
MRQAYSLLITGVLFSIGCAAQDPNKNSVELSTGIGMPVGAFASKDPKSIKSGLAKNGVAINLEYSHYFRAKLGFCLGLGRSVFPLDVDRLSNSNPNISASSEPWRVIMVYAGVNSRKKLRDKIILGYKAAVGLASSKYPEASIITYNNPNVVSTNITSNTGNAAALIMGATLKYVLSQKVYLAVKLDYLSTSPKFIVTQTVYNGQSSRVYNSDYTQRIQAITAGLSVSYNFVKRNR